jgi:RND family efflux transporter MFP subunit
MKLPGPRELIRSRLKLVLPIGLIALGFVGAVLLTVTGPAVSVQKPEPPRPLVRVVEVQLDDVQLTVRTHGTVEPRTEGDLVPEVSGPVVWMSPALVSGGSFESGDPLLRIDPLDYEVAAEQARANLARAKSEHRRASRELKRRRGLVDRKVSSASELDEAVNAERVAAASLREAKAVVSKAERDLERTEMRAPYAGRVREESVDVGQFVTRGASLGRIYAVDYAEVRLPIPDEQLAYLDLPLLKTNEALSQDGPEVILRARFAGADHSWRGRIVRTEAEIDRRSRMVNAVARVEDPYGRKAPGASIPLAVGLFVEAEIQGHLATASAVLPRAALRDGGQVWVVGDDDRLRFRDVDVLRAHGSQVVIREGLESGERVCISPLQTVVDGMEVRAVGAPPRGSELL